jgi:high affinity Mn2+ porin
LKYRGVYYTLASVMNNPPIIRFERLLVRAALYTGLLLAFSVKADGAPQASADASSTADALPAADRESFAVHGQFTYVEQETLSFNAPYQGANSLSPRSGAQTTDATLYLGTRLWRDAEGWINGEIDQGFGLNNTLGAAGFPSGEAYKVGKSQPYLRLPRLFIRQTLNSDDTGLALDAAANQLGGVQSANRVTITLGKFSVGDIFDANQFAHDPRVDFLNWAAIDAGTFDYAADAWGYTVGAAVEWYRGSWTVRGGLFDLSTIPNSPHLDPGFHEFQSIVEVERRHEIGTSPGRILLTVFETRGRMGLLNDAVNLSLSTGAAVDIAAVRQYRTRLGAHLNLEQRISADLGLFARLGRAAGNVESYEFTDIDRSMAAGVSLQGTRWHRAKDNVGLVIIDNGISAARQNFLNAGGLGILVGDGRLPHPGPEQIIESYYSWEFLGTAHLSFDYQLIAHPAYNRDRGPASVLAVRLHAQF